MTRGFVSLIAIFVLLFSNHLKASDSKEREIEFEFNSNLECRVARLDVERFLNGLGSYLMSPAVCEDNAFRATASRARHNTITTNKLRNMLRMPSENGTYHQDIHVTMDNFFNRTGHLVTDGMYRVKTYSYCYFTKTVDNEKICYYQLIYSGKKNSR